MKHTDNRSESERLERLAHSARRRGEPAEAARLRKAADRKRKLEQAAHAAQAAERARQQAAQPYRFKPNYFQRRLYEIWKAHDDEHGTNFAANYAHWRSDEPYTPPPPSGKSEQELDAIRQQMRDKLDAIIADLRRKGGTPGDEDSRADEPPDPAPHSG